MGNMLTNLWSLCLLKVSKQSSLTMNYMLTLITFVKEVVFLFS